ncbi:MAG: type I-A CRISPR-associated protein Cas5a [Candidatus Caldarchaeum sp.]
MKYLRIDAETHWGLLLNYHAFTKSRPALRVVPPTTVIGAVALPLALMKNWPETFDDKSSADIIRPIFKGVFVSQNISLSEYSDLSKIFSFDVDDKQILADAAAVGKIYCGPVDDGVSELNIVFLVDEGSARGVLGNGWTADLLSSAWAISRVGARESIVSVRNVEFGDVEKIETDVGETRYYFPLSNGKPIDGEYTVANVVDWRASSIGRYIGRPTVQVVVPYDILNRRVSVVRVKPVGGFVYKAGEEVLVPW